MDTFDAIVVAAVRLTRSKVSLLWADQLAARLAEATPLSVDLSDLSERITAEAIRQSVPVVIASEGFRADEVKKAA